MAAQSSLTECFDQFFAYLADQMGHLTGEGNAMGAAYVGSRLDGNWRWLEYEVTEWFDERYRAQTDRDPFLAVDGVSDGESRTLDAEVALQQAQDVGAGLTQAPRLAPWEEAIQQLHAVDDAVGDLSAAIKADDVRGAAIAAHLARRAFSAYRLAKYTWMDEALDLPEVAEWPHLWLEA